MGTGSGSPVGAASRTRLFRFMLPADVRPCSPRSTLTLAATGVKVRGMDMSSRDERPDAELMRLVRQGEPEAFAALVRRHQNKLLNFFRALGVSNDAEDLVQETFLRLFRYRYRYQPTVRFTTFLYLLARQVRIDRLRKDQRYAALCERASAEHQAQAPSPRVPRSTEYDWEAALNALPDSLREVVILSVYQGLNYDEVADILSIPVGTVKSRMFHAMRRLKAFLLDSEKEDA